MEKMLIVNRGVWLLTAALAVLYIGPSIPMLFGAGDWDPEAVGVVYGVGGVVAGVLMLAGLFVGDRAPRASAGLVIGGAVWMAILWFWLAYALVPLTLLVVGFAVYRAQRASRQTSAGFAA